MVSCLTSYSVSYLGCNKAKAKFLGLKINEVKSGMKQREIYV